jgi:hypothetical protein
VHSLDPMALTGFDCECSLTGIAVRKSWPSSIFAEYLDRSKALPQLERRFHESEEQLGLPDVVIVADSSAAAACLRGRDRRPDNPDRGNRTKWYTYQLMLVRCSNPIHRALHSSA